MVEIIFTRPDNDREWERRINTEHVPQPGNFVKVPDDETSDMLRGTIYEVDEIIWSVLPGFGISQVEIRLIDCCKI
jgi:hypothetical protein